MNHLKLFVLVFLLFHSVSFSQNAEDSLKYGLTFSVGSNFTLQNFEGSAISGKYFFDAKRGLRITFSLDGYNLPKEEYNSDTLYVKAKTNVFNFSIVGDYFIRLIKSYDTYFYVFGGPRINFGYRFNSTEKNPSSPPSSNRMNQIGFGGRIGFGVEYYFRENMTLGAEYAIGGVFYHTFNENNNYKKDSATQNSLRIFTENVNLSLSVYF